MKILYFIILSFLLSGCFFLLGEKNDYKDLRAISIDTLTKHPDGLIRKGDTLQFVFNFDLWSYSKDKVPDGAILLSTNNESHFMTSDSGVARYCDDNNDTIRFFNNVGYGVTQMVVEKSGVIRPVDIGFQIYALKNERYHQLESYNNTFIYFELVSCRNLICTYPIAVVP